MVLSGGPNSKDEGCKIRFERTQCVRPTAICNKTPGPDPRERHDQVMTFFLTAKEEVYGLP